MFNSSTAFTNTDDQSMWNESLAIKDVTTTHDMLMFYLTLTLCCIQSLTLLIYALVWKAEASKKAQRLHCLEMILQSNRLSLVPISQTYSAIDINEMCASCRMMEALDVTKCK